MKIGNVLFFEYVYLYAHTHRYICVGIIRIYIYWSVKLLHKECSMKERYNTSNVFKQRKQLIWNLRFHADTAAIFSQMNKTLNLQYRGIFCII